MYTYKAKCIRVVDGDTVELQVDLGFHIKVTDKFRLLGIDTAEIFRPVNEAEKTHGLEAKAFLEDLILDKEITVHTSKQGKYGRYLAEITTDTGESVVRLLEKNGYAKRDVYI